MLGKNGEPQDDISVNFYFDHTIFGKSYHSGKLVTDVEGKVYLGELEGIHKVTAQI